MIHNTLINKARTIIDGLFPSFRYYRIFRSREKQYGGLLTKLGYKNETCDGEQDYLKFWNQLTKRVSISEYRLFSNYMGCVPYIVPDYIGTEIIAYYLNPRRYNDFYEDKNAYNSYVLLNDALPRTYANRIGGGKILLAKNGVGFLGNQVSIISYLQELNVEKFVLKPTIDSCSGHGVMVFNRQNDTYLSTKGDVLSNTFLEEYGDDFILQEAITQHPELEKFNPTSVNTLRICTFRSLKDESIEVTGALIRIGKQGEIVDNAHAGGRFVGIDIQSGTLLHYACDQYGNIYKTWNNISFEENHTIPNWGKVKEFAKKVASYNKHCRLLALDITVDKEGNPRLIEINIGGFSFWLFLFCGQDVFAGETQSVVDYCNKKMAQDNRKELV